jgi:hypothetical protein
MGEGTRARRLQKGAWFLAAGRFGDVRAGSRRRIDGVERRTVVAADGARREGDEVDEVTDPRFVGAVLGTW